MQREASTGKGAVGEFHVAMKEILEEHRPSQHALFADLGGDVGGRLLEPEALGEFYHRYQAAMHATRVAVYHLPHLDTPSLRTRKVRIYVDDDGLEGGDTHHAQLRRAFTRMGARLDPAEDDALYGDLDALAQTLDPGTSRFVLLASKLYPRSLGAWCAVETLSDDWMHALSNGLARHHPGVQDEPYFKDCFHHGVEHRHGEESVKVTSTVLASRPGLLAETVDGAWEMARALDGLWGALREVLRPSEAG